MVSIVKGALDVLGAVWDVLEAALDFRYWWGDWDRTWSPASFLLVLASALGLAVLIALYGGAAWTALRSALG